MEFPQDVWGGIMSFIPHVYRKTLHYDAIMSVDTFRARRYIHKNPFVQDTDETFYMHLIISSWWYWAFPDIQNLMIIPEVYLTRNVAKGHTKKDFIEIFDAFARSRPNSVLGHIQYDI